MWILWTLVAIILCIYASLRVKETTLHQKRMSIADWPHLRRQIVETGRNQLQKTNPAGWNVRLQGVDYCCSIRSKLQQLCCRSCTKLETLVSWARRFSDFLGVCSSLAPMASNLSVSTPWLCFFFLSKVYSPNCELFVRWEHFHHETYVDIFANTFQQIHISHSCQTKTYAALTYTAPWCTTQLTENKQLMEMVTAAYCWQNINSRAWTTQLAV
jgi:hypothetical protein